MFRVCLGVYCAVYDGRKRSAAGKDEISHGGYSGRNGDRCDTESRAAVVSESLKGLRQLQFLHR